MELFKINSMETSSKSLNMEVPWGIILWQIFEILRQMVLQINGWMGIKRYSFLDDVPIDCKFMLEASRKATHSCANCWGVDIGKGFLLLKVLLLSLMARISS